MDVHAGNFEREVREASRKVPVLVDFWAPWCAPCRALGPILEKLEAEYGGRFRLTKVNSDENQALAAELGIRSIPDVYAFRDGKPVAHFLGALPESQVRAFIDKLLPPPELALAEQAIAERRFDEVERLLARVKPNIDWDAKADTLRQALAFARAGGSETDLAAKIAADPADHESRLALAFLHAGQKRYRQALEQLLEIVRRDKEWRNGEARRQILAIFSLAGNEPELVAEYRRKLASALY